MRPKLIALIAVSAVALVGCASGEPSVAPANVEEASPSVFIPSTPEPTLAPGPAYGSVEQVEEQFADFAELRAEMHAATKPDRVEVISDLHKFCDSGASFDVSKTEDLNVNLDVVADSTYCGLLDEASSDLP